MSYDPPEHPPRRGMPYKPDQNKLAADFNAEHPVGTPVQFWPGAREGWGCRSQTRTEASVLSGHTAVVWVNGRPDCIALSHVKPLTAADLDAEGSIDRMMAL